PIAQPAASGRNKAAAVQKPRSVRDMMLSPKWAGGGHRLAAGTIPWRMFAGWGEVGRSRPGLWGYSDSRDGDGHRPGKKMPRIVGQREAERTGRAWRCRTPATGRFTSCSWAPGGRKPTAGGAGRPCSRRTRRSRRAALARGDEHDVAREALERRRRAPEVGGE